MYTAVFIDGGYLEKVLQYEHARAKVNFQLLVKAMVRGGRLLRAYYYNCPPYQSNPPTDEERRRFRAWRGFENALRDIPKFDVRMGKLVFRGMSADGKPIFQQKRVDLMLGVDMALLAGKGRLAEVVLLSGDSDFVPAIEAVKKEGILTALWHGSIRPNFGPSRELLQSCDEQYELTADIIRSARLRS